MISDKELLGRIVRKDSSAFKELYIRYAALLFDFVMKKVKSDVVAEDITQEFWLKVWEQPTFITCNSIGSAKSFIVQQIRFRVVDNYRRAAVAPILLDDLMNEENMKWYEHVAEELDVKEAVAIINEALQSLPETTRRTFWMRLNNCPSEEVAAKLSLTLPTTYNKFSQALTVVRGHIQTNYPEFASDFVNQSKKRAATYSASSYVFVATLIELFK